MSLRINDTAPDFTAETSTGTVNFHEWISDGWALLFSHPKDFTPVCATELSYVSKVSGDFAERGCKVIGLSVDKVEDHQRWAQDIEDIGGMKLNFPLIADTDLNVAKLYDMLPAEEEGTSEGRTAATNATVRTVFLIGPDKKIKMSLTYPMSTGTQLRRAAPCAGLLPTDGKLQGRDAGELEQGRGCHHRSGSRQRRRQGALPGGLGDGEALPAQGGGPQQLASLTEARTPKPPAHAGGFVHPSLSRTERASHPTPHVSSVVV